MSVPTVSIDNQFVNSVVMPVLAISVSTSVLLYKFDAVTSPVNYPDEEQTNGLFTDTCVLSKSIKELLLESMI